MILQRLNMDSAWFLALDGTRLLIDPWLEGVEIDVGRWLNIQWHRTPPIPYDAVPDHDAVLVTQKYPDHYHEATLRRLAPKRVLAPASLGRRLKRLLPEADIRLFGEGEGALTLGALTITHLPTRRRIDPIYDAYVITGAEEVLLVANHGFHLDEGHWAQLGSAWRCDVLLSPFNRYALPSILGGVVAPGLEGLEALIEQAQPRAVAQTHDEPKHGRGLVPLLARITRFDPEAAAEHPWLRDRFLHIPDYLPVTP